VTLSRGVAACNSWARSVPYRRVIRFFSASVVGERWLPEGLAPSRRLFF
jgi:hypothetical protein